VGLVSEETYVSHAQMNIAAGIPVIQWRPAHDVPLAIVGGGPSAGRALPELREWPGHIWAINQGSSWLAEVAPQAQVWLFSVDPDPCLADWVTGVERAILGTSCHPKVFAALAGKDVQMFHTREVPGLRTPPEAGVGPQLKAPVFGPSSVCRTFVPAALLGYKDVSYFGCEGSFEGDSHAYRHEARPRQMIIRAGGEDYRTTPDYYMTTQFLANVLRQYPKLKERSGGLLRAMIQHWDTWEVVALSAALRDAVDPSATAPYERVA
jgi:hypothetical protein